MASPNQTVADLSPESEAARVLKSLQESNLDLLKGMKEREATIHKLLLSIKQFKENEESLKGELKASQERNLKEKQRYHSEISNLQHRMGEQYENYKALERKWNSENQKLESQKRNLSKEFDMANKRVIASKERIRELNKKLQVLEALISETKRELMSRIESSEERFDILNETCQVSFDDFEALNKRLSRVESIVDQGVIDQMNATIKSLERKLDEQRKLNLSVDGRGEVLFVLQKENEQLEGHVKLLEDLLKTMIG